MSFIRAKMDELGDELRKASRTRESLKLIGASPEAGDDDPFHAWITVAFEGLHLRLVRDRDREHIDLECAADGGTKRWVSLEILAVAANRERVSGYITAFKATLEATDGDDEAWEKCWTMWERPLEFVVENVEDLIEAVDDTVAIREAEARIAEVTGKLLASRLGRETAA